MQTANAQPVALRLLQGKAKFDSSRSIAAVIFLGRRDESNPAMLIALFLASIRVDPLPSALATRRKQLRPTKARRIYLRSISTTNCTLEPRVRSA